MTLPLDDVVFMSDPQYGISVSKRKAKTKNSNHGLHFLSFDEHVVDRKGKPEKAMTFIFFVL